MEATAVLHMANLISSETSGSQKMGDQSVICQVWLVSYVIQQSSACGSSALAFVIEKKQVTKYSCQGNRRRLLVLIPLKAAHFWWPTDDTPKVTLILIEMVVSVSNDGSTENGQVLSLRGLFNI